MTSRKEAGLGCRRGRSGEGREDTDLVEDADDAAAGENEGPPFAVRGLHGGMLTGDHGWSLRLATERHPDSRSLGDIE